MRKSNFHLVLLFVLVFLHQGCTYTKIAKPEPQIGSVETMKLPYSGSMQFSYSIIGDGGEISGTYEEALRESFLAVGIRDMKKSVELENERVNLFIYVFPDKEHKLNRYFGVPWAIISLGTLTVLPHYAEHTSPFEVHIIKYSNEAAKRLKIFKTELVVEYWTWPPFFFISKDQPRDDRLFYQGLRRVFDGMIMELVKD